MDATQTLEVPKTSARMGARTILITGSHGALASALMPRLAARGFRLLHLVRHPPVGPDQARWDPLRRSIDAGSLEGVDAAVHLAAEPIPALRWTRAKKARIYDSRIGSTRLLAETLAALRPPPRVLLSASAAGFYGDRGDEVLVETSRSGEGFLARVCRDWEAAADPARAAGIRVVHLRSGNVFQRSRGFLRPLVPLFSIGLGGRLGSGRQYLPWIAVDDWAAAVEFLLEAEAISGPVNLAAPQAATNREFTRALARVLRRPAVAAAPAAAVRLVMGELGREILASQRVRPVVLMEAGFAFGYPDVEAALRHVLRG